MPRKKPKEKSKKKAPVGMISTKKPEKPCPPHTKRTLDCLNDGGEIYCGQGKVWVEADDGAGEKGKCMTMKEYKTYIQNKLRDERKRRRSAAKNMANNKNKSKLKF